MTQRAQISSSHVLGLLVLLLSSVGLDASAIAPDFEGFLDGTVLTNQYPGLTFSNTTILTSGAGLNEFEFPPFSGANVAYDDGGPITITFDSPVPRFGGYFTYLAPLILTAFDAGHTQVNQVHSLFGNNLGCLSGPPCFGDPGSSPNEFLELTFASGIKRVTIQGDPLGSSFTMDGPAAIPEPATALLLSLGLFCLFAHIQLTKRI